MLERTLTLGCLNDWSMMPLRKELRRLSTRLDVLTADQAGLSDLLEENKLAAAACCLTQLMKTPQFDLALPMGVAVRSGAGVALWGSSGAYAGSGTAMQAHVSGRIPRLKEVFDYTINHQSKDWSGAARFIWSAAKLDTPSPVTIPLVQYYPGSSIYHALSKVLIKLLYGDTASDHSEVPTLAGAGAKMELLAGNDALVRRTQYPVTIDLIELWEKITGLPFVLQAWLRHQEPLDLALRTQILKVAEFTAASMRVQPMGYYPENMPLAANGTPVELAQLWRRITYKLGPAEMKSILLFLNLVRHLGRDRNEDDQFVVKMIRLQQRENELSQQV